MRLLKSQNNGGFTFFEVVVVLVLIGIFTTVAIVQHARTDPSLTVQSQVLRSHIRYAQMRSMNSDTMWGIRYRHSGDAEAPYYELYAGDADNIAPLPGEAQNRVRLGAMGISIESAIGVDSLQPDNFRISFDGWGQPYMDDTMAAESIRLNLVRTGHGNQPLTVTQHTGFIR